MTRPEERLAELLHDTTPEPVRDLSYEGVVDRVRARRRSARALAVGGTAIVAVVAVVAVAALSGARTTTTGPVPTTGPSPVVTPTPSPRPPAGTIDFQGVRVTVPAGWSVREVPICGFSPDRTVTVQRGVRVVASCPYTKPPAVAPRSLELTNLYGWSGGRVGAGPRTVWHGQPASRSDDTYNGVDEVTLVLPWLNVVATATGRTHAEALALLDSIAPRPSTDLGVPVTAEAVEVVWEPVNPAEGYQYQARVTRAADIASLLADLRAGSPLRAAQACDGTAATDEALLTVKAGGQFRTFAATFGSCGQLSSGRGVAAQATNQLRVDVRRMAPPLKPYENPAGCTTTRGGDRGVSQGSPSAPAALVAFLAGRPAGFPRSVEAFREVAEGIFLSAHTEVVVDEVLPPGSGYAVEASSDCPWYY